MCWACICGMGAPPGIGGVSCTGGIGGCPCMCGIASIRFEGMPAGEGPPDGANCCMCAP